MVSCFRWKMCSSLDRSSVRHEQSGFMTTESEMVLPVEYKGRYGAGLPNKSR
jgi:hypothetical protein